MRETTGPRLEEVIGLARGAVEAGRFLSHKTRLFFSQISMSFSFLRFFYELLQAQQWRARECETIPRKTQSRRGELELQRQLPGD